MNNTDKKKEMLLQSVSRFSAAKLDTNCSFVQNKRTADQFFVNRWESLCFINANIHIGVFVRELRLETACSCIYVHKNNSFKRKGEF